MIVPFNPMDTADFYEEYYSRQVGDGLAVYSGRSVMDGDGLLSLFSGVARRIAPALKGLAQSAVKSVGRQALNVAKDVASGRDFKESALDGLHGLGGDVINDVVNAVGGAGTKRKRAGSNPKRNKRQRRALGPVF